MTDFTTLFLLIYGCKTDFPEILVLSPIFPLSLHVFADDTHVFVQIPSSLPSIFPILAQILPSLTLFYTI